MKPEKDTILGITLTEILIIAISVTFASIWGFQSFEIFDNPILDLISCLIINVLLISFFIFLILYTMEFLIGILAKLIE